jgi:hypothetical protein
MGMVLSLALSFIGGFDIGARALHVLNLTWFWLNRSPIPVGRGGSFFRSNDFYLPSLTKRRGGSAPCGLVPFSMISSDLIWRIFSDYIFCVCPTGKAVPVHLHGEPGRGVLLSQLQLQAAHQGGEGEDQKGPAAVRSSLNLEKVWTAESIE